jgi:hypothetical protein
MLQAAHRDHPLSAVGFRRSTWPSRRTGACSPRRRPVARLVTGGPPRIRLATWRNRGGQCLPRSPPAHATPPSQLPDRQPAARLFRLICSNSSTLDRPTFDLRADDTRSTTGAVRSAMPSCSASIQRSRCAAKAVACRRSAPDPRKIMRPTVSTFPRGTTVAGPKRE